MKRLTITTLSAVLTLVFAIPAFAQRETETVDRTLTMQPGGALRVKTFSGRVKISEYGIDRFNDYCRSSVLRYTEAWQETVTRQARWVDFKHDYKTMDLPYMESVMWAFKQLYERGLIYEGYRVMPYSWAAQTPVSTLGKMLSTTRRPSGRVTSERSVPVRVKSGARVPTAGRSPTVLTGEPPSAVVAMSSF